MPTILRSWHDHGTILCNAYKNWVVSNHFLIHSYTERWTDPNCFSLQFYNKNSPDGRSVSSEEKKESKNIRSIKAVKFDADCTKMPLWPCWSISSRWYLDVSTITPFLLRSYTAFTATLSALILNMFKISVAMSCNFPTYAISQRPNHV